MTDIAWQVLGNLTGLVIGMLIWSMIANWMEK
jgi:hypothetical protein